MNRRSHLHLDATSALTAASRESAQLTRTLGCMNPRTDYHQIATKLDCTSLEKKLAQLLEQTPPKTRKSLDDVLAPFAKPLRKLRAKGWSYEHLAQQLTQAGLPVKPNVLGQCLNSSSKRRKRPNVTAATG